MKVLRTIRGIGKFCLGSVSPSCVATKRTCCWPSLIARCNATTPFFPSSTSSLSSSVSSSLSSSPRSSFLERADRACACAFALATATACAHSNLSFMDGKTGSGNVGGTEGADIGGSHSEEADCNIIDGAGIAGGAAGGSCIWPVLVIKEARDILWLH